MSVKRYVIDENVRREPHPLGDWVQAYEYDKIRKEVERLQKIIDEQSVVINCLNRLKPNKDDKYLVQWWYDARSVYMAVKSYNELDSYLSDLVKDSSITDMSVCALRPVKVTSKKVLTVEL